MLEREAALENYPLKWRTTWVMSAMPLTEPNLWTLINTWPLPYRDEMDYGLSPARRSIRFEDNLRTAGDWTIEASERITDAYRRFLYLKAISGETLTPPSWIDAAWHQHLAFATNYVALEEALGRRIVHRQRLTSEEREAGWDRGRELWEAEFDDAPPIRMWPPRRAWWRPWAAVGVMIFAAGSIVLFLNSHLVQSLPDWMAFIIPVYWLGCGLVSALLIGDVGPDKISRCG